MDGGRQSSLQGLSLEGKSDLDRPRIGWCPVAWVLHGSRHRVRPAEVRDAGIKWTAFNRGHVLGKMQSKNTGPRLKKKRSKAQTVYEQGGKTGLDGGGRGTGSMPQASAPSHLPRPFLFPSLRFLLLPSPSFSSPGSPSETAFGTSSSSLFLLRTCLSSSVSHLLRPSSWRRRPRSAR